MRWIRNLLFVLLPSLGWAAFPAQFTYQGSLKHNGALVNGTYPMEFRLTNSDGSQTYWTSGVQNISVQEGLYRVELSPTSVTWGNVEPYVQVSVNGNVLLPREKLNSAPYALIAKELAPGATARGDFQVEGNLSLGSAAGQYNFHLIDSAMAGNQDEAVIQAADPGSSPFQLKFGFRSNRPAIQGHRVNIGPQQLLLNPEGGNVGVGLTNPNAVLTLFKNNLSGAGTTNTLFAAGYNSTNLNGQRQFLIQQWLNQNQAKTYVMGNGFVSGTASTVANDPPGGKLQGLEFTDQRFNMIWNNGGNIQPALTMDAGTGFIGIGNSDPSQKLDIAGNIKVDGSIKNEQGKPAFFVSVLADDCGWAGRLYFGCPSGYTAAGRWHTGPGQQCDSALEGEGYENGQLDRGWMVMCVAQ